MANFGASEGWSNDIRIGWKLVSRQDLAQTSPWSLRRFSKKKMARPIRHVMKLVCQLDNCSSTYSYHKILVCYNSLFNPEMKRVNFFFGKQCSLTCLLLWRGLAYITQDKWNKLAASENSGLLQYFTIIRQVFIMLYSGTTHVLPALKGNLVMTVYRHCPAATLSNLVNQAEQSNSTI